MIIVETYLLIFKEKNLRNVNILTIVETAPTH
jgi:hypothetical protein